jgi:predicted ATPase
MKIQIKDLGAVKEATIDLKKKLIIFCGPNNTGKTYIAYTVYGLLKERNITEDILNNNFVTNKLYQELLEKGEVNIPINKDLLRRIQSDTRQALSTNIHKIFGLSPKDGEKLFSNFQIKIENSDNDLQNLILDSEFSFEHIKGFLLKKDKNKPFISIGLKKETMEKNFPLLLINAFCSVAIWSIFTFPLKGVTIFPVERNSIYTFSKELSLKTHKMLDDIRNLTDPNDLSKRRITRYPQPIRDCLEIAEDISNFSKRESKYHELAEQIEIELLHGKISITKDGEVQFSSDKAKSKRLPVHLSASIVKTLSSLVFYLKHLANENDLIIIDEPELNLHPDNQILIARIFARLINNGFRLLVSTHSDYIIRELNNLIMLSSDNIDVKNIANKLNYHQNEKIDSQDVGAYLFKYTSKTKVTVSSLEVNETGFSVETIDNVINSLNEKSEELFFALKAIHNE